jgi:hypothetical protein
MGGAMNAVTPIAAESLAADFSRALAAISEWRGQMIQSFALAELAVSEALLVMVESGDSGKRPKLPHLVGQRSAELAARLADPLFPGTHARPAAKAVERFRRHEPLRTLLCHGVLTVSLTRCGRWVAEFRMLAFKAGSAERSARAIDEGEAARVLAAVATDARNLASALGQVRRSVRTAAGSG